MIDVTDRRHEVASLVRSRWGDLRLGGAGADALTWGMVLKQIGYLCPDSALPLIINYKIDIARLVFESGRTELIERYAIPIAEGRLGAGFAYTEGADAFSFRTVLHRKGDGYVLSGDLVACLVERDGLTHAQRFLGKQRGWTDAGHAETVFDPVIAAAKFRRRAGSYRSRTGAELGRRRGDQNRERDHIVIFELNGLLLGSARNQRSVSISAATLGSALTELSDRFTQMRRVLLDNSGESHRTHRAILNGELISRPESTMPMTDDDRIEFYTAIAGG